MNKQTKANALAGFGWFGWFGGFGWLRWFESPTCTYKHAG